MYRQILTQTSVGLLRSGFLTSTTPAALTATLSRRTMYSSSRAPWAQRDVQTTETTSGDSKFEAAKKASDEMDRSTAALKEKLGDVKGASEPAKATEGEDPPLSEEEQNARQEAAQKLAEQAAASEKLWNLLVPERNMGITSPAFLILLVLTILLHLYNNHMDEEMDELMKKKRILRIKREKLEREGKVDMSYFQPADAAATEGSGDSTTEGSGDSTTEGSGDSTTEARIIYRVKFCSQWKAQRSSWSASAFFNCSLFLFKLVRAPPVSIMVRTADGDATSSVTSSEPRDSVVSGRFTRSTLSRLEKERSRLILELDEYRDSNVALRSDLEQCVDRLNACEDELVFQHNELERSTKEGFHLKKKVEKMEALLKREFGEDATTQYSALLDENERLQDELDDMADEREQLEAELQHHQASGYDIDDMTQQLELLTDDNKDLSSEVDDLKEESDRLRRKLATLQTEHEVAVAKLSAIDKTAAPVVQEGVQTDEAWLPTIKEEVEEEDTRGVSQDTQLSTLRMAYDLLQEENEETKHQLALLTDASEDGGTAARLIDVQRELDEYRKQHPDTPSTSMPENSSSEMTPEKERSSSSITSSSAIAPPILSREDSNKVDPLEKHVEDVEASLRDKDGKIAALQGYVADLERMQQEGAVFDGQGKEVVAGAGTTPKEGTEGPEAASRAARLASEIESYQEQLKAKDEQINELKRLADSSAEAEKSASNEHPEAGDDFTVSISQDDLASMKSQLKKLEEEKKLSDSQLEYVQSEYDKLRKEKEKQVMELEHTIVDTKLKLAQVHSQADKTDYSNYRSLRNLDTQHGRDSPRKHDGTHRSGGSSIRSRSKGLAKSVGKALGRKSSTASIAKP
ncbi:hypothetical protein FOZ63_031582 [Perkinsus olseni]|uniref:Uncharacterized protein n=1 Tax=Perkinsus olseni TaxID=32597 RepID=A0A7J6RHQ6_PEROL|nr:hypothetical protein FOZ63_031582 [Perkinsus olseni]